MKIRCTRQNSAVSEVFGTILLLGISITLFTTIYATVLSMEPESSSPSVNIVATIEDNDIILEHRGGEVLFLDSKIILTPVGGTKQIIVVGEKDPANPLSYLYFSDVNDNDRWNIGERFVFPLDNISSYIRFTPVEIMVVDVKSNSLIMNGIVSEARIVDVNVGFEVTEEDLTPNFGETIDIGINASNIGPSDAKGIIIKNILPTGLIYNIQGTINGFNENTGIWNVGNITKDGYATITIPVKTIQLQSEFIQLALLLDASRSVNDNQWELMLQGLSNAVAGGAIPHNNIVEFTIIQFGGDDDLNANPPKYPYATVEIEPVILSETNYMPIANTILEIERIPADDGETPIGCAFRLAADILSGDPNGNLPGTPEVGKESQNFNSADRQIINAVTDGMPNCVWIPGTYTANWVGFGTNEGKESAEAGRDYIIETLEMTSSKDEIDVEAVQGLGGEDIEWLRDEIVWPGGYEWTDNMSLPPGPGWVRKVDTYTEFSQTIDEQFDLIFDGRTIIAKIIDSMYLDSYKKNNECSVIIKPDTDI